MRLLFLLLALLWMAGCGKQPHAAVDPVSVTADAETEPILPEGDVADDPAIWIDAKNPGKSLIIGTDKKGGGLEVYDLSGKRLQRVDAGKVNNVDLRYGMIVSGRPTDIVAGSDRSDHSLALYAVDPQSRTLYPVAARNIPSLSESYGLCMYRSAESGNYYVFVNSSKGEVRQFELFAQNGKVDARPVRDFSVGSQTEGCVADDESGYLYIGEENVGIWRYGAEPGAGLLRVKIDSTQTGHLVSDVEGLALYTRKDGKGYLIASSQGNDTYTLYDRQSGRYLGAFKIEGGTIDGVTHTDGIDATSVPLGEGYPHGLFVAQDDRDDPSGMQNFKILRMEKVLEQLGLPY